MATVSMFRLQVKKLLPLRCTQILTTSYCTSSKSPTQPSKPAASPSKGKSSGATSSGNTYECGQYYEHNEFTYYDIEKQMAKARVGQPASPRAGEHC